jgi:hypothetical protein
MTSPKSNALSAVESLPLQGKDVVNRRLEALQTARMSARDWVERMANSVASPT